MRHLHRLILVLGVLASSTIAEDAYAQTAERKFGRGLAAIACGFLEVPGNIVEQTEERGAIGIPIGLAYGIGMLVTRELVGPPATGRS